MRAADKPAGRGPNGFGVRWRGWTVLPAATIAFTVALFSPAAAASDVDTGDLSSTPADVSPTSGVPDPDPAPVLVPGTGSAAPAPDASATDPPRLPPASDPAGEATPDNTDPAPRPAHEVDDLEAVQVQEQAVSSERLEAKPQPSAPPPQLIPSATEPAAQTAWPSRAPPPARRTRDGPSFRANGAVPAWGRLSPLLPAEPRPASAAAVMWRGPRVQAQAARRPSVHSSAVSSEAPAPGRADSRPARAGGSACGGSGSCAPGGLAMLPLLAALGCLCALLFERLIEAPSSWRAARFVTLLERPG